jgi:hypothetical protein
MPTSRLLARHPAAAALAAALALVPNVTPAGPGRAAAPAANAAAAAAHGCAASCALAPPTADELAAIVGEADRLVGRYGRDSSAFGRQCHALGATMRGRAGDVRMLPFMWREPAPDGHLAPVTGDAHTREPAPGAGTVHIARGFDALNPDRGITAIVQTARHEFAHLNGLGQAEGWGVDAAAELAAGCGEG